MSRRDTALVTCLITVILFASSFLYLYNLGAQRLHNDEARYSEVVIESFVNSHHIFSLFYQGTPYFSKSPLLFWLVYVFYLFVPNMQIAVRLPSALASIALVAATMLIVYEVTQSKYAAALGGGILATTASFAILIRAGRFDSLATLFIVLAVYSFIRAFQNRKWFLVFGACMGLIVMVKGPVVMFAGAAVLAFSYYTRRWNWLRDSYFWGGVGIAVLIVFPWYIHETVLYGGEFWNDYVLQQIIARVQTNIVSINLPVTNQEYVTYFFEFLTPWSILFIAGVLAAPFLWRDFSERVRASLFTFYVEIYSVIVVCFLMESKAYRYLLPCYPFIAATIAILIFEITSRQMPRSKTAIAAGLACLALGGFIWSAYNGFFLNPSYPYSTDTPATAIDEYYIGTMLLERHVNRFYIYDTADVRGIVFYSHIDDPYNFPLYGYYNNLYFVLPPTKISDFINSHPRVDFRILYKGIDVVLAEETGQTRESLVYPYCSIYEPF
jgi:4-amino-4-deoxy-L-arabinose transferase